MVWKQNPLLLIADNPVPVFIQLRMSRATSDILAVCLLQLGGLDNRVLQKMMVCDLLRWI